ncbi:ABC transporter ATP-binding protein [Burkholderia ubonensis]|uniref:ABC transporter ATP-binding protein n=1 Tax=Burkholderia ubonensis TaxID=101571 RepID=UPI000758B076|nr:sn-glycerol-3-phosphate ABC transporter ATP-binding protein UgpC [Burkholderia ubonensis]KVA06859.1 ABC transporter [Burkholderia ubonensis]KVA26381.1 ABC transporter [Burkholderia ubonensis]KVA37783.1 ABC transporter [Burkholderia ubonensis]
MASVVLRGVSKAYGSGLPIVRDVDLDIAEGEFCVFLGASGCGKSTLLRMIAGLEDITDGEIFIGNRRINEVPPARRGVSMVFQSYALFPHMTVYENLSFGLTLSRVDKATIRDKVLGAARALQIEHLLDRKPRALSGGQRQRVAIGRAIVREPGVFLFDEPLSNLDAALRVQTRHEIARIHREIGHVSTIYVTHDQVEAMTLADRVVLLNSGEATRQHGSLAQAGSPLELYHHPSNRFVAGFIGSPKMNFIDAVLVDAGERQARVRLASGEVLSACVDARRLRPGEPLTLGIRPEDFALGSERQHLVREATWQERLGEATYVYLRGDDAGQQWIAKLPGTTNVGAGHRLSLFMPPDKLHAFDGSGQALRRCIDEEAPLLASYA